MKEKILELRGKGYSYKEIVKELGCSTSTVSYYCGKKQKEKVIQRTNKRRALRNGLEKRIENFSRNEEAKTSFTLNDIIERFGEETVCMLSGEKLNLLKETNFHFDHIVPRSRGGDNSISNFAILHKTVNKMKHNLLNEELIDWCVKILIFNGYEVKKP